MTEINARQGTRLRLHHRLYGGAQGGAWLLSEVGEQQEQWVLKIGVQPEGLGLRQRLIGIARDGGWPTPEWLCHGTVQLGKGQSGYYVQRYVDGRPVKRCDSGVLNAIMHVNELQCEMYSQYDELSGSDPHSLADAITTSHSRLHAHSPQAKAFVSLTGDVLERLKGGLRELPVRRDLVHGDYSLTNFLFRDKRLHGIIDCGEVHVGSRLVDLVELMRQVASYDWPASLLRRVVRYCDAAFGVEEVLLCSAYVFSRNLDWCVVHRPDEVVSRSRSFRQLMGELSAMN